MTQSNDSHSASGAGHSPFMSAQSALARKPLPGPIWAWPVLAAIAAAGLVYLVTSGPAEHPRAAHPAPALAEELEAPAAASGAAGASATPTTPDVPATAPAVTASATPDAPAAPTPDGAAAAPAATEPAKTGDDGAVAVASASTSTTKKKARGARRASRKRASRVD